MLFLSCSKVLTQSKSQLLSMARKVDPAVKEIIPENINAGIKCSDYGPGCMGAFQAQMKRVKIIFVQFKSEEQAKAEALRIDQYYSKHWVFDDVTGEPVLENLVKKVYKAQRPSIYYKKKLKELSDQSQP